MFEDLQDQWNDQKKGGGGKAGQGFQAKQALKLQEKREYMIGGGN